MPPSSNTSENVLVEFGSRGKSKRQSDNRDWITTGKRVARGRVITEIGLQQGRG
jgi:hypothetical protein